MSLVSITVSRSYSVGSGVYRWSGTPYIFTAATSVVHTPHIHVYIMKPNFRNHKYVEFFAI